MSANSSKRLTLIHDLEKEHQNNLHKTELIHRDEEARLLALRTLTLRDDNAVLNNELVQKDERIDLLAREGDKTRLELDCHKTNSRSKDAQLNKQAIELASLRVGNRIGTVLGKPLLIGQAEVDCLNASMKDSTKVMQEKITLTRELDRLRPEMEHLQSQLADYQTVVAQKHDFQRQVNSLEVELENEKHSRQHSRDKEVDSMVNELRSKLEEAEKQAAVDKKERDKMKLEHERELAEAHGLTERLEERISTLKTKLKGVQSELRETQAELQTCQISLREAQASSQNSQDKRKEQLAARSPNAKKQVSKKGKEEATVQTPNKDDTVKRPVRKRATEQALLGEKSTFSITPFLNRTKNLLDNSIEETPDLASATDYLEAISHEQNGSPSVQIVSEPSDQGMVPKSQASDEVPVTKKAQKARGRPRMKPLSESPSSEKNRLVPLAKRAGGQDNKDEPSATNAEDSGMTGNVSMVAANGKKKRKLLGSANKTIFEEEDGETIQKPAKGPLGPPRRLKAPLGGAVSAFAATSSFSPLKRDRRGVNASFLA
ncbi:hypothetical protein PT974_09244 [Cladobotryum mycophilum]|uniref:Rossmann-fold NAD(P)(+)-binding protein n=1 Tax=Cladobotryum mycophilum TaxID=491253 RepID=A0ABR0SFN3_9HYPO